MTCRRGSIGCLPVWNELPGGVSWVELPDTAVEVLRALAGATRFEVVAPGNNIDDEAVRGCFFPDAAHWTLHFHNEYWDDFHAVLGEIRARESGQAHRCHCGRVCGAASS